VGGGKRIDSGKSKFSGQDAPAVPQQRARSIPPTRSKKTPSRLFFQSTVCIFRHLRHRQFPAPPPDDQATLQKTQFPKPKPAAEPPKPVDSNFDGLARLLELCIKFVLAQLCFWVGIEDGGRNYVEGNCLTENPC